MIRTFVFTLFLMSHVAANANSNCGPLLLPKDFNDPVLRWHPYVQNVSTETATIMWSTRTHEQGRVEYWPITGNPKSVSSVIKKLLHADTAIGFDLILHQVNLNSLNADTDYCYRVFHGEKVIASGLSFRSAWGANKERVRFITFGDCGDPYSTQWEVRKAFMKRKSNGEFVYPFDFWLALGDVAYNSGTYKDFDQKYFRAWQGRFDEGNYENTAFDISTSFLWNKPVYHTLGNHEYDNGGSNAETYIQLFDLPISKGVPETEAERYYSFDYGNVHIVSIDGNKFGGINETYPAMLKWLEADLAVSQSLWKIVITHLSPFSSSNHGTYGDASQYWLMRERMIPILQKYSVSLVLSGHDHLYQRSKKMKVDKGGMIIRERGSAQPRSGRLPSPIKEFSDGIVYVVAGNGGADLHPRQADPDEPTSKTFDSYSLDNFGEGYDFVAKRKNKNGVFEPILYTRAEDQKQPLFPENRFGFTYVDVQGCKLTLRSLNYEHIEIDKFELDRCNVEQKSSTNIKQTPTMQEHKDNSATMVTQADKSTEQNMQKQNTPDSDSVMKPRGAGGGLFLGCNINALSSGDGFPILLVFGFIVIWNTVTRRRVRR